MRPSTTTQDNLEWLIKITPGGETRIAQMIGRPLTQPNLSKAVNGKRRLTFDEAQAIELHFCIPNGWLHIYPLKKAWQPLITSLQKSHPMTRALVDAALKFAQNNAPGTVAARTPPRVAKM